MTGDDPRVGVDVPASLDLLDPVGNGMDCERYLWIRALSDPDLPRKARIDVLDDAQRFPGAIRYLASRDGAFAATTFTLRDDTGAGSCYLRLFTRDDPGEPVLGDAVAFAVEEARRGGVTQVRFGDAQSRPVLQALLDRHGFEVHEQWRRFHREVARDEAAPALPDGLRVATLAERPDLAEDAFRVYRDGLADTPGDFPRPEETLESWLRDMDGSPIRGRALEVLIFDRDDRVLAMVELERLAAGSDRAWVEFLAVDRERRGEGLGFVAKQQAVAVAAREGLRRLQTMNHESNAAVCRLNERLGWVEDPVRLLLRRELSPA